MEDKKDTEMTEDQTNRIRRIILFSNNRNWKMKIMKSVWES